jgi:hypothetical protein
MTNVLHVAEILTARGSWRKALGIRGTQCLCLDWMFELAGWRLHFNLQTSQLLGFLPLHLLSSGCRMRRVLLKERFALRSLRSRNVPSKLEAFFPQAQGYSSETLMKRSVP